MAQRTCSGENCSPCCPVSWLRRRAELENMPMNRIDARTATESDSDDDACSDDDVLIRLLEVQNQFLCDILAAVNSLTAAQLAARQNQV